MCGSILWKKEELAEFERIRKMDDMCVNQLKEYAIKEYPTPKWASSEIERAFILGLRVGRGEL